MAVGLALAAALLTAPAAEPGPPGAPAADPRPGEAFAAPEVARLQRTATDVQRELADLAGHIHDAERELRTANDAAAAARAERTAADDVVAAQQAEVDAYSATVYETLAQPEELRALLSADDPSEFLDGTGLLDRLRADQDVRLAGAVRRQTAALAAEDAAEEAAGAAGRRKADLDRRNADASDRAAAVSSELRGVVSDTNAAVVAQQKAQQQRNRTTADNWRAYLDRLAAAGITPPPAERLRDPDHFPAGLTAMSEPGVAERTLPSGERLLVLPAETVAAVTHAVDALGKPYVPDGAGPVAYSCDGLVSAGYGAAVPPGLADQYAVLAPVTTPHPGDLVFLGPKQYGVQGVGIVLDERTMLAADARLAGVVVTDLPADALGFARPALAHVAPRAVPEATDDGLPWRCGGVSVPSGVWGGYPNGFIPQTALCPLGMAAHRLRCDAAAAFGAMNEAYTTTFGTPMCLTDSYRGFDAQVRLYAQKPALAAVPGTSNHGWGLALDLCGGAQSFGSAQYAWLRANALSFGWVNPEWAWPGRGREEPWHWEFGG
ncbi:D-alanyl-D-alanine carboxypeptidase family protein [Actinophytocola algeriensis]|uniref:Prefoldin subunit 5 n=1 Tax=Actinophytocola algeriensis TaxID=1768010 RepID=A0A7W7Q0X8_9PSEU|nr:D-alanyl-D-alanine carboxypeptidase family protein [Actinophytocola algeriensis]MBB4904796.1 prefoldin subunit 5 [Actinophytocola algeriensis]MBE1476345.1 prefoldin subunit 5 [Actinophytocola algeriensis]